MVNLLKEKWLLILILGLGLFLRVYRLDYLELFGDEVDAGYQSYSLLTAGTDYKGHVWPTYFQSFSEWRAPGLMYLMAPFIRIFGLNEWGVRLGPAIMGVISIGLFYVLLRLLNQSVAIRLWSVFLLAINPWHIQYSRAGFELTLMAVLIMMGAIFLFIAIKRDKVGFIWLASMWFSGALYTYSTANILVPLFCLIILIYLKATRLQIWRLFVFAFIFCLPIIWQIIYGHGTDRFSTLSIMNNKDVTAEVESYRNRDNNSLVSKIFFNKYIISAKRIVFNYTNAFSTDFLFRNGDVTFRHSLHQVGNLYWIMLPLVMLGLIGSNKFMWWWLLIAPLPACLTVDGFSHASRLFWLLFPLIYFAGAGLSKITISLKYLVLILIFFEFSFFQFYYWNYYANESWRWWHFGYKEAMTFVDDNKAQYEKVLIDNTYEPALIRYLFWNKVKPTELKDLNDNLITDVDKFKGFCLKNRICFVDYGNNFKLEQLQSNRLYLLSQEKNLGGDWNLNKDTPEYLEVLKTVLSPENKPIFYLVRTK